MDELFLEPYGSHLKFNVFQKVSNVGLTTDPKGEDLILSYSHWFTEKKFKCNIVCCCFVISYFSTRERPSKCVEVEFLMA